MGVPHTVNSWVVLEPPDDRLYQVIEDTGGNTFRLACATSGATLVADRDSLREATLRDFDEALEQLYARISTLRECGRTEDAAQLEMRVTRLRHQRGLLQVAQAA